MKYTVRYAHLAEHPAHKIGDTINRGDIIGIMGSTGQSTGAHLHIDVTAGENEGPYKLSDIGARFAPSGRQLDFFIDSELFASPCEVTTPFMDQEYRKQFGKDHPAIDVVPKDRKHKTIFWNRSMPGTVVNVLYQPESYGNVIYICFEA